MKLELGKGLIYHLESHGEGSPVLCLSGLGCDHYNYALLKRYIPLDYELIMPDWRGLGASLGDVENLTLGTLVSDMIRVLEKRKIQKCHLVGISMGGMVAQLLALEVPQLFSSLALLGTTGGGDEFLPIWKLTSSDIESFYSLPLETQAKRSIDATLYPLIKKENPKLYKEILAMRMNHTCDKSVYLAQNEAARNFLEQSLPYAQINIPALVLHGRQDRLVPVENAYKLGQKIPQARLRVFDQADHLFFFERSKVVAESLVKFWQEVKL